MSTNKKILFVFHSYEEKKSYKLANASPSKQVLIPECNRKCGSCFKFGIIQFQRSICLFHFTKLAELPNHNFQYNQLMLTYLIRRGELDVV